MKYTPLFLLLISVRCLAFDVFSYQGIFIFHVDRTHSFGVSPGDLKAGAIYSITFKQSYEQPAGRGIMDTVYQLTAQTDKGMIRFEINHQTGCVKVGFQYGNSRPAEPQSPFKIQLQGNGNKRSNAQDKAYGAWQPVTKEKGRRK